MKILLTILFILLISRIKSTPSMLSKKIYLQKMQKSIDKQKESTNGEELNDTYKGATILIVLLLELFFIIFYTVLGTKVGTTLFMVLSAIQITTCIYTVLKQVNNKAFSQNIEDFKFYRWYFLFNVILDYVYYPMAIYMLLK